MEIWKKIPFFASNDNQSKRKNSSIQMNPSDAIARFRSKSKLSTTVMISAAVLCIIFVQFIRTQHMFQQSQTQIFANLNMKHSVHGVVSSLNSDGNTFTINVISTYDTKQSIFLGSQWRIYLPPGDSLNGKFRTYNTCFINKQLNGPFSNLQPTDCKVFLKTGKELIIEWAILRTDTAEIVAKTIIGTQGN